MCKCTPNIRTPYCGKLGCEWPGSNPEGARVPSRTTIDDEELASLRRDAGRYRLIRDAEEWDVIGPMFDVEREIIGTEQLQGEQLDEACDAHIAAMSPDAASGKAGEK